MGKEKLKPITPLPNPSSSSINYNKPAIEIPPIDIDQSQY
jgi:hypothetical protein